MVLDSINLLLIEDDPEEVQRFRDILTQTTIERWKLESGPTLEFGLRRLHHKAFDAVIVNQPATDPVGLQALLRATRSCQIAVLLRVEELENGFTAECVGNAVHGYLHKNQMTAPLLEQVIRQALDRLGVEEKLRKQEAHLRSITHQLPGIFWTTDTDLNFTTSRGGGLADLELQPDEVVGQHLTQYLQTTDPHHPAVHAHLSALAGDSVSIELEWQNKIYHTHVEPLRTSGESGPITGTIGMALDVTDARRVEEELRVARKIQQGMLPKVMPHLTNFDISGLSYPARATGGDYFDYIPMKDGLVRIAIGDVSSHGFGPAILMATLRAYLRALCRVPLPLTETMSILNRLMRDDLPEGDFASLFLGALDNDKFLLNYCSAGHPSGYVLDRYGDVQHALTSTDTLLGIFPSVQFQCSDTIPLMPGDLILLTTDGLNEAFSPDDEPFGPIRAVNTVRQYRHCLASEIVQHLYRSVRAFSDYAPQLDDISMVVIKVRG